MQKNSKTPRFEVDYKERLQQAKDASDAVRLPRLGYIQYRVYELPKKKDKVALNNSYGQATGRGLRPGPISPIIMSVAKGRTVQYSPAMVKLIFDELDELRDPPYTIKWLKPKHATALRLKGHRVEEHG